MHLLDGIPGGIAASLAVALSLAVVAPAVPAQQANRAIRCESSNGQFNRCMVPWRDAQLVRQESKGACIRGQSWGVDRQGLWVDRGCRGQFAEVVRGGRPGWDEHGPGDGGWRPGPDWNRQIQLQCDSNSKRYSFCQVDVGGHGRVRLVKQLSDTRCSEGYSWGWNRAGVWTDHGCRGVFVVDRRW
ncbi:hypothetical protein B0E46_08710 [Rhodanobacter sp. B04]|uniref:DUF3011 domain-containing protein n=1 Tax=Rhodanobacter sp. B04 TaxID=1945860 RepID=UPI000985EF48|nr:DUF3011 domain-containing protein [Rhodanobacter sp. B04]OOG63995.1 hypothetical protein B0E46_08710 [Rhodanobacter sp. B04]